MTTKQAKAMRCEWLSISWQTDHVQKRERTTQDMQNITKGRTKLLLFCFLVLLSVFWLCVPDISIGRIGSLLGGGCFHHHLSERFANHSHDMLGFVPSLVSSKPWQLTQKQWTKMSTALFGFVASLIFLKPWQLKDMQYYPAWLCCKFEIF